MRKTLLKLSAVVIAGLLTSNPNQVHAQRSRFNTFASAVFMTINGNAQAFNVNGSGADLIAPNASSFTGRNFGTFTQNSASLWFMGSEVKTYKQSGANVCGVSIAYGIQPYCDTCHSQPSTEVPLYFKADCDNGVFADGYGPCSFGDQKWRRDDNGIDLTNRAPGTYIMDVYYKLKGSDYNPSGCEQTVISGAYEYDDGYYSTGYRATFNIVASTAAKSTGESTTDLAATTNNAGLSVYPSPATSMVSINPVNFDDGAVQVAIINIQGLVVKKIAGTNIKGQSIDLDMSSYAAGLYFVRLQQGAKTAVAKVVKQ